MVGNSITKLKRGEGMFLDERNDSCGFVRGINSGAETTTTTNLLL
jgi:hypothetical protein